MLAKMPQQTDTSPQSEASPFRNKLTVFSLVLFLGVGLSAGYMIFPLLQPATPVNVSNNTTEVVLSAPNNQANLGTTDLQNATKNKTANKTSNNATTKTKVSKSNTSKPSVSSPNTSISGDITTNGDNNSSGN